MLGFHFKLCSNFIKKTREEHTNYPHNTQDSGDDDDEYNVIMLRGSNLRPIFYDITAFTHTHLILIDYILY